MDCNGHASDGRSGIYLCKRIFLGCLKIGITNENTMVITIRAVKSQFLEKFSFEQASFGNGPTRGFCYKTGAFGFGCEAGLKNHFTWAPDHGEAPPSIPL